jgi:hypothetical protein
MREAKVGGSQSEANLRQKLETLSKKIANTKKDWECGSSERIHN